MFTPTGDWITADILIEDGLIKEVGEAKCCDAECVDATGRWVVPGLIDAHVHLLLSQDSPRAESREQRLIKAVRNARRHLEAGVTTVRDCGAMAKLNIEIAKAIGNGVSAGPNVVACGDFIAMTGGHVWYWAHEADGPDEVRKAVRQQIKAGAGFIKVMASGGAADPSESPNAPQLDEDEMRVAVHEARKAGVLVASHAHSEHAILASLRAGVDTIEHGTYLREAVGDALLESGAAIVPTFAVYRTISRNTTLSKAQRDIAKRVYDAKCPLFASAAKRGIRYGVGTDSGSYYPAGALVDEMQCMVETGLSAKEVLLAATRSNAEILGVGSVCGSIEKHKRADLLVLKDDPVRDICALRDVEHVMKDGVRVSTLKCS